MKKGFTLVELLVVVVVIVTLLGVTFRLAGVGSDSTARNVSVNRLQRLENCLSGYYAAYGSYPPVKLHGSRNYKLEVDEHGLQRMDKELGDGLIKSADDGDSGAWNSIDAACKSQPIGMTYPFNRKSAKDLVSTMSAMLVEANPDNRSLYQFEALIEPSIIGNDCREKSDWKDTQVFRFGVLSYLLPRYLIILGGDAKNDEFFAKFEQWRANNQLPPKLKDGVPFENWEAVNTALGDGNDGGAQRWMIAALPSQATCARWLPNLEEQLATPESTASKTYGVELKDPDSSGWSPLFVYPSSGEAGSSSQQFIPDRMTILDGWSHEFYYYSKPPHQSYRLWSAGKNGKTFPPWEDLAELNDTDRKLVGKWIADDIVQMSN